MFNGILELFGKNIIIKGYDCITMDQYDYLPSSNPRLVLYIQINEICNAFCGFCNIHNNKKRSASRKEKPDMSKLKTVLAELLDKNIISRIGIAGGEPFLDFEVLNNVLNIIFEIKKDVYVTINTNGSLLQKAHDLEAIEYVAAVHLSRHHYDDEINNSIFKVETIRANDIKNIVQNTPKEFIRLNCNLINGYIDNYFKVEQYLKHASELGILNVGMVCLTNLNQYCKENYVQYKGIVDTLKNDSNAVLTSEMMDTDICNCQHMTYNSEGKNLKIYFRDVKKTSCSYCRELVYTCDNKLLSGFSTDGIVIL